MAIEIYSDGSSHGVGGKAGGWSFLILQDGEVLYAEYGSDKSTTNNIMELEGAIRGIRAWARMAPRMKRDSETVTLVCDSQVTLGLATGQYVPKANVSRAEELAKLYEDNCNSIKWVRGHSGEPANERCDRLAKLGKKEAEESDG